jgi:histidinol dehydrogenase
VDTEYQIIEWSKISDSQRKIALARPIHGFQKKLRQDVTAILADVKLSGDLAVQRYTEKFDGIKLKSNLVTSAEIESSASDLSESVKQSILRAARNIEVFHRSVKPEEATLEVSPGLICKRKPVPIAKVGLYIPGGTAVLPSTVLMLGIPAKIAGNAHKIITTPPDQNGNIHPAILFAAKVCGIDTIFKAGGAQAIGAMAYGTASIPKVDKIFGPGNSWVTEAKIQASLDPEGAICDMPAGPSEVLVIGDADANPEFAAADLLSQAEHGVDSQVLLVSDCPRFIQQTIQEIKLQLQTLPRQDIARQSLNFAKFILVDNLNMALTISDLYAPEHLILQVNDAELVSERIKNAGSVFLGKNAPESTGDYASGTNHVLPTYGYAKSMSGISVDSFIKYITFQHLSDSALLDIGPVVETLARVEGLEAHARAVSVRIAAIKRTLS